MTYRYVLTSVMGDHSSTAAILFFLLRTLASSQSDSKMSGKGDADVDAHAASKASDTEEKSGNAKGNGQEITIYYFPTSFSSQKARIKF